MNITAVVTAYNVKSHIENVVKAMPLFVNNIIVVDDKCPQETGSFIEELNLEKVIVIFHKYNQGVGGAVVTGYKKALELNSDIVVKVDGDGQMNPANISKLIQPIIDNKADYTKGNRFVDLKALKQMPKVRLFGNSVLSFLVKVSSGYWDIMDPTNGFTAISKDTILGLELEKLSKRFFFESDMLINLNIQNCVVKDVSFSAKYEDEESSLSVTKVLFDFPSKLFKGLLKRIFYKYYIYDFNMASIYMLLGFPLFMFGIIFGSVSWYSSFTTGVLASTGSIMIAVLPIILGVQFLLQAISIDIENLPEK